MVPRHSKSRKGLPQLQAFKGSCCGMVDFWPIMQQAPLEGIRIFSYIVGRPGELALLRGMERISKSSALFGGTSQML